MKVPARHCELIIMVVKPRASSPLCSTVVVWPSEGTIGAVLGVQVEQVYKEKTSIWSV